MGEKSFSHFQSTLSSIDTNECTEIEDACPNNGVCRNTEGSFVCDCPLGYKSSDDGTCVGMSYFKLLQR